MIYVYVNYLAYQIQISFQILSQLDNTCNDGEPHCIVYTYDNPQQLLPLS